MPDPTRVTADLLRGWPLPEAGSDKASRGLVVVVGGSRSTPGAVALAGESSLRVGGGKLQVVTARTTAAHLAVALPEAGVLGIGETPDGELDVAEAPHIVGTAEGAACVLLGPGLLDPARASALLGEVVPHLEGPVVVDALGSAYLTDRPDGLHHLDGRCVVTVNPTELARTLHVDEDAVADDPVSAALELARLLRAVVVCGGETKAVAAADGQAWLVTDGGPGLGVAGSGDVQAGLVAGLLARGAVPVRAAVWGAYLHAAAGDRLAATVGPLGFLARELPAVVPGLLDQLTVEAAEGQDAADAPDVPHLLHTVLDTTEPRRLAEFYRELLGLHYRPGDEPGDEPRGEPSDEPDWLVLVDAGGERRLAFQKVDRLIPTTWPEPDVPMQLHLDLTVDDRAALERARTRAEQLGARLLLDRTGDAEEPLYVLADPSGHPFCVFVA